MEEVPIKRRYCALLFHKIPKDLKDLFKAYCARRGISMTDIFVECLQKLVMEDGSLKILDRAMMTKSQKIRQKEIMQEADRRNKEIDQKLLQIRNTHHAGSNYTHNRVVRPPNETPQFPSDFVVPKKKKKKKTFII